MGYACWECGEDVSLPRPLWCPRCGGHVLPPDNDVPLDDDNEGKGGEA